VGKYGEGFKQGLAGVVAELVKAKAAQSSFAEGSEEAARNQIKVNGFQTAAQRAAAQAGITDFTQAKATIDQYTAAFTPAVENLVRLQQEQQQAGQTVGENSEQYQELGFKVGGAQKALDDLVAAQVAGEKAAQGGAQAASQQAQATTVAAGSLGALRQQLLDLLNTRETLDPTTKEAEELNTQILTLRTNIQQAEGKIDEFGERVQKNIKKENFDTVTDAVQGMVGAFSVATLVLGENSDAAAAQAKALQLMTIAQSARAIAIGLDSAKDATQIVLLKAKSLFLKEEATLTAAAAVSTEAHAAVAGADAAAIEGQAVAAAINAEAQAAGAEATAASTVATEAQVVATEGATIAQQALNLALRVNPIGLVIIAVAALVSLFAVYRNASDATQKKIRDITETLLRFTTPIGIVYTGIEKLYQRFELVRKILDPVIKGFNLVAGEVLNGARAFGEYIGLLDTAAQKASKLAAAELERAVAFREQADAEVKASALAGASARQTTQDNLANIDRVIAKQQEANEKSALAHQKELRRIQERIAAGKTLSDSDKKINEEAQKASVTLINLLNERSTLLNEGVERDRAARQQEAADIQTNAQRAVQNLQRRIEQQDAAENAQLQRRIARLDTSLSRVQKGTADELFLQQRKIEAQTALEIKQTNDVLAEKIRLRAVGYAKELTSLNQQEKQALDTQALTELQKTEITSNYAQQRAEVEQKYSLKAAQDAVKNIPLVRAASNAQILNLYADFERQANVLALESQIEQNRVKLASTKENSQARYDLEVTLSRQEEELSIAALDKRAMSNLAYETKVTAIRAEGVARRKALYEQETGYVISNLQAQAQGAELNQQLMLAGLSESKQLEVKATQKYTDERLRAELDGYTAARLAASNNATQLENAEKQHQINLKTIAQEAEQNELANAKSKYDKISAMASQSISALGTIQDAATQDQLNRIDKEMNKATTSTARKAVLAKQEERISQQQHERQKQFAKAQAVIDLGSAIMRILADTPKADFGVATAIGIALAGITAAAQIRAIDSQKFATGGIVQGPSHARGGVQLWHRSGAHVGEMEGGEAIINKRSTLMFGPLLSAINQMGGGKPFGYLAGAMNIPAHYAEGGIVRADSLPQTRTSGIVVAPAMDYDLLASKLADTLGGRMTTAFVQGAKSLPAPETNITDLRQRLAQQDKLEAETNI